MSYDLVRNNIVVFVGLVISIGLHEFGHAAAAVWLGDPTPRSSARLLRGRITDLGALLGVNRGLDNRYTLNPVAHADPIGTVVLPLFALFLGPGGMLFGWGRPVPFNPLAARAKVSQQKMIILVSLAGPAMNVLQFLLYSALFVGLLAMGVHTSDTELLRASVIWVNTLLTLNLILAVFNLLPVPPLDGGHILVEYLKRTNPQWAQWMTQYGLFVLIFLLLLLPVIFSPFMAFSAFWSKSLAGLMGVDLQQLVQ